MRVFLPPNDRGTSPALHTMHVAPAADMRNEEAQAEWVDQDNKPITMPVVFTHGQATVPDPLGKYLIARGLARKQRSTLVVAA